MSKNLLSKLTGCISRYKDYAKYKKVLTVLALFVVLGTIYILMEPGITMEEVFLCENTSENIENEDCYGTESDKEKITYLVNAIDSLPTVTEMNNHVNELSSDGGSDDEIEKYKNDILGSATDAYDYYLGLNTKLQNLITNIDKLLEYVDADLIEATDYSGSVALLDGYEEYGISTLADDSNVLDIVEAVSTSEFIELNLYDYGSNINDKYNGTSGNKKYPGFQWNGGAYLKGTYNRRSVDYIDFGNSMITDMEYGSSSGDTNGKSSNAVQVTGQGGAINTIDNSSYGITNRPIGMSLNSSITSTSADVLSRTLGEDGYPALADGTSLAYLFTKGTYAKQQNTANIDGLFQQDETTGEYFYNSRWNHAQYSNNKFTLYEQIITPNFIVYPFGNFLPFNDITSSADATNVGGISSISNYVQYDIINTLWYDSTLRNQSTGVWYDKTAAQLVDMLAKYRSSLQGVSVSGGTAWSKWDAKDAIEDYFTGGTDVGVKDTGPITDELLESMYNIDWDVDTNFFFGMEMKMNFMQPKDGMTGNDTNKDGESDYPMEFYFTGDDDVWVYIDDVLFLDLSGIHRHVGGKIDFVEGKVYYYALDSTGTGDVSTTPYQTYTFEDILREAGKSTEGLNSNGTFKDYTTHSFKFYYMERGSGSSVCRLNFNFPLLKQNSINVSKELSGDTEFLGSPDFKFQVLKANSDGTKTNDLFITAGTNYTVYDSNDNVVRTGTTDANGVFTLKAGQRAEFTGIKENSGKYYVRELLDDDIKQYVDGEITVSGESTTKSQNVVVGNDTFTGLDSPVKDMSNGSTIFRFDNKIDANEYGTIEITKVLEGDKADSTFDFEVTLDGTKLPVGTKYTVTGTEGTTMVSVSTAGKISIKPGEVATISKILAGTIYEVKEVNLVANDYTVKYVVDDKEVSDISGEIKAETKVEVIVTNIANKGELKIPITKIIANPYLVDLSYSYEFKITEIDGNLNGLESDNILEDIITITVTSTEDGEDIVASNSGEFVLKYDRPNYSNEGTTYYYKIEEILGEDETIKYDDNFYIVKVVVTRDSTGLFSAKVTNVYYNDFNNEITKTNDNAEVINEFTFTNHLLTDLIISKEVINNVESSGSFDFELKVTYDENLDGIKEVVTGDYGCERGIVNAIKQVTFEEQGITSYGEEVVDTSLECIVTLDENGVTNIELSHNEYLAIYGFPYKANYILTELNTDGYIVEYQVNNLGIIEIGKSATADLNMGNNYVKFINIAGYELPSTGSSGMLILIIIGSLLFGLPVIYIEYTFYKRGRRVT